MTSLEAKARAEQLTSRWRNGNKKSVLFEINNGTGAFVSLLIFNNLSDIERKDFISYLIENNYNGIVNNWG